MAHVGQRIVYRLATSDYRSARITKIENGTTVSLVAFATGDDWDAGTPGGVPVVLFGGVQQGTGVGQWQEETEVDPAVLDAIDAAVTDYCAVPAASSAPSLALDTARQPNTSRPVLVIASGTWSWSLSVIGTVAGIVTLTSDASSSPTTPRPAASFSRTVGVGITISDSGTLPWCLAYIVPPGHYYQLATSGSGTFALDRVDEQAL